MLSTPPDHSPLAGLPGWFLVALPSPAAFETVFILRHEPVENFSRPNLRLRAVSAVRGLFELASILLAFDGLSIRGLTGLTEWVSSLAVSLAIETR